MATVAEMMGFTALQEFEKTRQEVEEMADQVGLAGKRFAPLVRQIERTEEALAPFRKLTLEIQELPAMKSLARLERPLANASERYEQLARGLNEAIAPTLRATAQLAQVAEQAKFPELMQFVGQLQASMRFPPAGPLASRAAIQKYPEFFHPDGRVRLPEPPSPCPPDSETNGGDSVRGSWVRVTLQTALSTAVPLMFLGGGDTHITNYYVTSPSLNAPVRVEPHGKAPIIERVGPGASLIVLDTEDRWCPVWPVRDLEDGWLFRGHLQDKEQPGRLSM